MTELISTQAYRALFAADAEFAVIDPRETSAFASGHLLAASNLPLSRLENLIELAVPHSDTLCVFCDNGAGEAETAVELLRSMGYSQLAILDGGIAAWEASGGAVFTGTSVPGKAFGEFIEKFCATPSMSAAELHHRQQRNEATLLIDSRTAEEHESYCIPGAVLCPGAELIYRVLPIINADTEIVVHCGGRTRSIIGAQTLIDAGCNNVHALENGTMAWQSEGLELEQGDRESLPQPDSKSLILTRAIADQLAERWHIDRIDSIAAHEQRSRYLIDVRSREEFEAGHIEGSRHIPGGHLLQNVDRYLVVRNAVVVLIDSEWVRAVTTAVWLRRMGWRRVYVFTIGAGCDRMETGSGNIIEVLEDRALDPNDYADHDALMRDNRAYLEWEIALIDQLSGEPAAPYMDI
jgi:rhodanese-related sulfurtransferase